MEPRWRRYLRFFGPRGVDDLDDELQFHADMRIRDYMANGMSERDARAAAAQRLGDIAMAREKCKHIVARRERSLTRAYLFDSVSMDVRFAFRSLGRQKGWTAVAVLTLALGIGANAAMFSVVNKLLLNPIAYPGADRVVLLNQEPTQGNNTGISISIFPDGGLISAWRSAARSFEAIEPYVTSDVLVQRPRETPFVAHGTATRRTFGTFAGERPLLGRMFSEAETRGEATVVLLGEGMWRSRFGADRGVVGRTLRINDQLHTVIGVMPATLTLPRVGERPTELWLPLNLAGHETDDMAAVGRLRAGVSRAAAAAELDSVTRRQTVAAGQTLRFRAQLMGPADKVHFQDSLLLLSIAVALVLLIACANVAHLLLARAATRQREMAIRAALGAGTRRLFRQLLTESFLLASAGCVGGLIVAWAGLRLLVTYRPQNLDDLGAARMDLTSLLVTAAIAVATGIAFGVIGAVQAARHSTHDALKAGSSATSSGWLPRKAHVRGILVVTEMALCTMLLVGAGLLLRSVMHLQTRDPGFDAEGLYAMDLQLPQDRYDGQPAQIAFMNRLRERAARLPGVEGITIAASTPPGRSFLIGSLQLEGDPDPPAGITAFINYNGVQPEFFDLMGMRLIEGTTFTDTSKAAAQVIVNAGMARRYWPDQSALGRKLRVVYESSGDWKTVVGVAPDALIQGLTGDASAPMLYLPAPGFHHSVLIVRTSGDAAIIPVLSTMVAELDARLPPPRITSVRDAMLAGIARPRFTLFLLVVFTVVAVGLAAVGLYGVLSYSVTQRTREIGIRMALGASRQSVARAILSQGLALSAIGAVIGLLGARFGATLVGSMLYGVRQTDSISFGGGAVTLIVVALLACLVPVRRASAVDPLTAIRAD